MLILAMLTTDIFLYQRQVFSFHVTYFALKSYFFVQLTRLRITVTHNTILWCKVILQVNSKAVSLVAMAFASEVCGNI